MNKTIIETRQTTQSVFRSEDSLYREDARISSFINMCKLKGIITNSTVTISEDGLSQISVYETESPGLLDALREFYFPGSQYFLEEWKNTTGNIVVETPAFNPAIVDDDIRKFTEFISEFEI